MPESTSDSPPVHNQPAHWKLWIAGARPRTLPAAVAPVVAGTGAAAFENSVVWARAIVALGVSLALQIGVNYANDYSDGVKGTDNDRVGPLRLVGSGLVQARQVKLAAFGFLGLGAILGLILAVTTSWWLIAVGAVALIAAWTYTGGKSPYGYRGLGEMSVFIFFGLVAVLGTAYVQIGSITVPALAAACGIGALACAILVANNLRDITSDTIAGKRTLAVRLGDRRTRTFFVFLIVAAMVCAGVAAFYTVWALLSMAMLPLALRAAWTVRGGAQSSQLIAVLRDVGMAELVYAIGLAAGLAIGATA